MDTRFAARVLSVLMQIRRREQFTADQLGRFQNSELRGLRDHAYAHSPFYRRFHHGLADWPLTELPVLTKSQLMDAFDDLVTDRRVHLADAREHAQSANHNHPVPPGTLGAKVLVTTLFSRTQPLIRRPRRHRQHRLHAPFLPG